MSQIFSSMFLLCKAEPEVKGYTYKWVGKVNLWHGKHLYNPVNILMFNCQKTDGIREIMRKELFELVTADSSPVNTKKKKFIEAVLTRLDESEYIRPVPEELLRMMSYELKHRIAEDECLYISNIEPL